MRAKLKFKLLILSLTTLMLCLSCGKNINNSKIEKTDATSSIEISSSNTQSEFKKVEDISGIDSKDVYTFVCELVEQKPSEQTINCADFGVMVADMKWLKWDSSGAEGVGIYSRKVCEPSCADGYRLEAPVKVKLEDLYTDGKMYFLTKFTYTGKKPFVLDDPITETWDIADFYITRPELR